MERLTDLFQFPEAPFFDDSYVDLIEGEPRNVLPQTQTDFIEARILKVLGSPKILDHCCGYGRHMKALETRGFEVTGLDSNGPFLKRARTEFGVCGTLIEANALDPVPADPFDLALIMNASLSCFSREEAPRVLAHIHAALHTGGEVLVHLANPDFALKYMPLRWWYRGRNSLLAMEERDTQEHGLCKVTQIRIRTGSTATPQITRHHLRLTYFRDKETRQMLSQAGFPVLQSWGDWKGGPIDEDHSHLIYHCRRT